MKIRSNQAGNCSEMRGKSRDGKMRHSTGRAQGGAGSVGDSGDSAGTLRCCRNALSPSR